MHDSHCGHTHCETNKPTNQQTNKPTNQQTNQPTNQQTNKETNQPTNQPTNKQTTDKQQTNNRQTTDKQQTNNTQQPTSFINHAPASFWAGLGGVRCACLEQALSFIAKVLAFGVLDTGRRLSTTSCRNSKRPSPSIQVLLVSLAHVRVLAALPAAASCRRRLRFRVPAFSLCVCRRRDRVCVVA